MTKIEELKKLLVMTGLTLPITIESGSALVDGESELICDTEAANPEELRLIVLAINMMPDLLRAADELANFIEYLTVASNDDGSYEPEIQRALNLLSKLRQEDAMKY